MSIFFFICNTLSEDSSKDFILKTNLDIFLTFCSFCIYSKIFKVCCLIILWTEGVIGLRIIQDHICAARFGTICTPHPWRSVTFSKVAGLTCNFTKIKTPPWVIFTFFKILQMTPNRAKHHIFTLNYENQQPILDKCYFSYPLKTEN